MIRDIVFVLIILLVLLILISSIGGTLHRVAPLEILARTQSDDDGCYNHNHHGAQDEYEEEEFLPSRDFPEASLPPRVGPNDDKDKGGHDTSHCVAHENMDVEIQNFMTKKRKKEKTMSRPFVGADDKSESIDAKVEDGDDDVTKTTDVNGVEGFVPYRGRSFGHGITGTGSGSGLGVDVDVGVGVGMTGSALIDHDHECEDKFEKEKQAMFSRAAYATPSGASLGRIDEMIQSFSS